MDRCSYFIKNRALFGSYPTQEAVKILENNGVQFFVDLTCEGECGIIPYTTTKTVIRYPIHDHRVPQNWASFAKLVITISNYIRHLQNGEKIYIHCKGGHGRAGIVVACVLCHIYKIKPIDALQLTSVCHFSRVEMREKWRKIGSPQTKEQKYFVARFFEPLYFYKAYKKGYTAGLSNFSYHPVKVDLGTFPSAIAAYEAYKCPTSVEYITKQLTARTPVASKYYGRICVPCSDWDTKKVKIMYTILKAKFDQNEEPRQTLIDTGLRPIVYHTETDSYWGDGNGEGSNLLGKMLTRIRNSYHLK